MFFRKKVKLQDFLEGPFLDAAFKDGHFRHEDFYEDFHRAIKIDLLSPPAEGTGTAGNTALEPGPDKEKFISSFIGAFLWLLKYRTLSSSRNSPRKLAFLDLLFDIEMPGFVERHLGAYDKDRIKEVYDHMDIRCKEQYTGEVPKGEPPPFLASPIWDKNAMPHPVSTAAAVFMDLVLNEGSMGKADISVGEPHVEEIASRFQTMTETIEQESARLNFSWSTPEAVGESGSDSRQKGKS